MPNQKSQKTNKDLSRSKGLSRRDFLKTSALLGGSLAAPPILLRLFEEGSGTPTWALDLGKEYSHHLPENQILPYASNAIPIAASRSRSPRAWWPRSTAIPTAPGP